MCRKTLLEAVQIVGGQTELAAGIRARVPSQKVSQAHVWKWLNRAMCEVPPAEYAIAIADTTGWKVTPHQLRPDIYPNKNDAIPTSKQQEAA